MSKNSRNNNTTGGIGFCGLLTIVFIVLKLLEKITWSWVWVLAPMWLPFAIIIVIIVVCAVIKAFID